MLLGRFSIAFVITVAMLLLFVLVGNLIGPGVTDYSDPIINGYRFNDAGHFEKTIIYKDDRNASKIVVDARVDSYFVDGDTLVVARRPREIYQEGGVTRSRLSASCEFYLINTISHTLTSVDKPPSLDCR